MRDRFNVFISSTSSDLRDCRNKVRVLLESYSLDVTVQEPSPVTTAYTFAEIDGKIDSADLVLCLVGHAYGMPLPEVRPAGVPDGLSWTQYEVWKAGRQCKPRMVFFHHSSSAPLAPDPLWANQDAWRQELEHQLHTVGDGVSPFTHAFHDTGDLIKKLQDLLDKDVSNLFEPFRRRRWADVVARYREEEVARWRRHWPNEFRGEGDYSPLEIDGATYIANQEFEELQPPSNLRYLPHLRPAAFVVGRNTEAEAAADTGEWSSVTLPGIKDRITKRGPDSPCHFFMVAGGGVGKSKSLERLSHLINEEAALEGESDREPTQAPILACTLLLSQLEGKENAIEYLAEQLAKTPTFKDFPIRAEEVTRRLEMQHREGRLVLLFDGLDHMNAKKNLPAFMDDWEGEAWKDRPVVVSGRPYALQQRFTDRAADSSSTTRYIWTRGWTFFRPCEFDESQQRIYLGKIDGLHDRYDRIPAEARSILSVPRVLQYVRGLTDQSLREIRSTADVYYRAVPELIRRTMANSYSTQHLAATADRGGGAEPVVSGPVEIRDRQLRYAVAMLSAAAFVMTKGDGDAPEFDHIAVDESFLREVYHRIKRIERADDSEPDIPFATFQNDFQDRLAAINAVVSNGVLDGAPDETELRDLIWSNKSVQCFFTALWLSKFARTFKWCFNEKECGDDDSARFSEWVWFPESQPNGSEGRPQGDFGRGYDEYYEINRFLAEMPEQAKDAEVWLRSIRIWFTVTDERPWRSAEMMYRSWPSLLNHAGEAPDDWWNTPYESVCGKDRSKSRKGIAPANRTGTRESRGLARQILAGFRSELQQLVASASAGSHDTRARVAREFVDQANWRQVPPGHFRMGAPVESHDNRSKTNACWRRMLDRLLGRVRNHLADPLAAKTDFSMEVSEETNTRIWFSGAQGERFRKLDVAWLHGVLRPLEEAAVHQENLRLGRANPDEVVEPEVRLQEVYEQSLKAVKDRWWACDQTPAEAIQEVAGFEMHRFPVLHEWFRLFAPGHPDSVKTYLEGKRELLASPLNLPGDNHPVIYVSWFDAWAFCQWANWQCPQTGRRYRCRLPHEPEWEYAARSAPSSDGKGGVEATPFGQPYWWGGAFYPHEISPDCEPSPECEPISTAYAHAVGTPGMTRPPKEAAPNGFGFHDILGNVWEWSANIYQEAQVNGGGGYSRHEPKDLSAVSTIELRAMRGGLWYFMDQLARCSDRFRLNADDRDYKMGFRVVREEVV